MKLIDYVLIGILVLAVVGAVMLMIRRRKTGCCGGAAGCNGNCEGCSGCSRTCGNDKAGGGCDCCRSNAQ